MDTPTHPSLDHPLPITEQKWPAGTLPVVSMCCIAHNHEKFIGPAIDSFLMQETTFPVEIIIRDDASTDGTAQIVRDYAARHPHLIRTILHVENQRAKGIKGFLETFPRARGEYIAVCEGDDYWTTPHKSQKQYDFIRANPQCSMCFGAHMDFTDGQTGGEALFPPGRSPFYSLSDLLGGNFIGTCTAFWRASAIRDLAAWCQNMPMSDWPAHVLSARQGNLGYVDEILGARRRHPGGVWSSRGLVSNYRGEMKFLKFIRPRVEQKYWPKIDQSLARRHFWIGERLAADGKRFAAIQSYGRSLLFPGARALSRRKVIEGIIKALVHAAPKRPE